MMHIKLRLLLAGHLAGLASLLLTLPAGAQAQTAQTAQTAPQPRLPVTDLIAGMHVIKAELAVSPAQQATGMMWRTQMNGNEGMLFVNNDDQMRCFWMKNTLLPLSIAFIAADGTIINLADMQPRSEQSHCSTKPARFALEMRQGWFVKHGIAAGFKLRGKPFEAR